MELRLSDRCTADAARKPPDDLISVPLGELTIEGDSIKIDGIPVLYRIEPHGWGDVHWERTGEEPVAFRRYTHIEVIL